jgi:hypothetical protein
MRRFCATIVLALATFLSIAICSAQQTATTSVPNLIRYSGTLKDAQGAALSSSTAVGVTFSIYKQQDGGAAVWMETQNVTPDSNGQYNVTLGSTTATGLPDDLFLQQEQRWLGVQVQGEAEQGRVLLVSVPYAFKAHEAETLGGLPSSSFVKVPPSDAASSTSTNVGSGTAGKDTIAVVAPQSNGSTVAQDRGWARKGTTVKLSNETDSVGIGTSTPKAKLEVEGNIHASGSISSGKATVTLSGNENAITVDNIPPTPPGLASQLYMGGENAAGTIPFYTIKVGIATKTISPDAKLSIFDPRLPSLDVFSTITPGNNARGQLAVATAIGNYSAIAIPGDVVLRADGEASLPGFNFGATKSLILAARNPTGAIRFVTGIHALETEKMTLLTGGNFGIANNQPQTLFSVGPQAVGLHSPFEVAPNGDMVRIKSLAYSWPSAYGTGGGPYVLTDIGGPPGTLKWLPGGGGGTIGGGCSTPGTYFLTKWFNPNTVQCSYITERPGTITVPGFVGIGPGSTLPVEQLDVRGEINAGDPTLPINAPTKQHYRIIDQVVLSIDGIENTFVGVGAGSANINGRQNTFTGLGAGGASDADANSFYGWLAGFHNTGLANTCVGWKACVGLQTGIYNTFLGAAAGASFNGSYNTFVGYSAAIDNTGGNNNIYVGSDHLGGESNRIRIGGSVFGTGYGPQTDTYIAGINSELPGSVAPLQMVCVDGVGKLWGTSANCTPSSRRFKEQIADMGDSSSKLFQLRPVTFFYKPQYDDGSHALQYGLIAEEVAKVYPEMAAYEKDGTPYTVKYQLLAPLLLNELQKEHTVVMAQQDELQTQLQQIKAQQQQMQAQRHEIDGLKLQLQQQNVSLQERLSKLESYVATQMKTASDNPPRTTPGANGGLQ